MERRKPANESLAAAVLRYASDQPQLGQAKVAEALREEGHIVSPSGVRYIWRQHELETAYKRLKALSGESSWRPTVDQRERLRRGDVTHRLLKKSGKRLGSEDRRNERRSQLLIAAAELFSRYGYAGTSIRDIARKVGLLPGSVYHYFPVKEDLFIAVHQESFGQVVRRIEGLIRKESDPWRRLELACAEHLVAITGDNPMYRMTGTGALANYDSKLRRRIAPDREKYENIFRRLIADLDLPRGVDRSLFRLSLLGALNWSLVWYRSGKRTPREIARRIILIFRGAAARDLPGDHRNS